MASDPLAACPSNASDLLTAPPLRTVSLGKKVWEQDTAGFPPHGRGRTQSCTSLASQEAGCADGSPRARSVFGLPMLSCCTRGYRTWSLLILLLDLSYSAFIVPIAVGLQVNDLEWTWSCIVSLVAGACFATELYLGFHVGYLATSGGRRKEVLDGHKVAWYYLRLGTFWQDLLSTVIWLVQIVLLAAHQSGVVMPSTANAFALVRIVRMVRFMPILRSISAMTVTSGPSIIPGLRLPPTFTHVVNTLYAGLVLVNFFGCLFNFIAIKESFENTWMNSVGQLVRQYSADGASMLTPQELAAVPGPRRWLTGFYFALVTVCTLGYGDITPSTAAETAVDCFMVAFGVLMFGMILGSIAERVSNSSVEARQAQMYRQKFASVHAWLHHSNMPRPLKAKVNRWYSQVWVKHAPSADASAVFFELPHKLRQEIAWEMNKGPMRLLPFFEGVDETVRLVLSSFMAPLELLPGQELCLLGDLADCFWVLHEGEVQVLNAYSSIVRTVVGPAILGESALLQHSDNKYCVRPHSYRSTTACSLWEVHLQDLMPFLVAHPQVLEALTLSARNRLTRESMASVAGMMSCNGKPEFDSSLGLGSAAAGGDDSSSVGGGWRSPALSGEVLLGVDEGHDAPCSQPGSPSASPDFDRVEGGGGELCVNVRESVPEEHTVRAFPAVEPWSASGAGRVGEEEAQAGSGRSGRDRMPSLAGQGRSIPLVVDTRGPAFGAISPFARAAEAAGMEGQEAGPLDLGTAVTRGELLSVLEALRGDLVGRLEDISLNVCRVAGASNTQAATPMWAAASGNTHMSARMPQGGRRSPRQLSGQLSRQLSPSSHALSSSAGLGWNFGQLRS